MRSSPVPGSYLSAGPTSRVAPFSLSHAAWFAIFSFRVFSTILIAALFCMFVWLLLLICVNCWRAMCLNTIQALVQRHCTSRNDRGRKRRAPMIGHTHASLCISLADGVIRFRSITISGKGFTKHATQTRTFCVENAQQLILALQTGSI